MTQTIPATQRSSNVAAWLLYGLQLLGDLVLALFAVTSVFMTDSCGSVADEPAVCDAGYFGVVLLSYWAILAVLVVSVPIVIVVAGRRGRSAWAWPLAAIVVSAIMTVLFVMLKSR